MSPIRALTVTLCVLLAAIIGASCGSVDEKQYQKDVTKVMKGVEDDFSGDASFQKASDFKDASKSLKSAADDLADIEPPDDVKKEHAALVKGVRDLAKVFATLGGAMAMQQTDPAKANEMMQGEQERLQSAMQSIEKAQASFIKKGYEDFDKKES